MRMTCGDCSSGSPAPRETQGDLFGRGCRKSTETDKSENGVKENKLKMLSNEHVELSTPLPPKVQPFSSASVLG